MPAYRRLVFLPVVALLACVTLCCQQPRETVSPTSDGPEDRRPAPAEPPPAADQPSQPITGGDENQTPPATQPAPPVEDAARGRSEETALPRYIRVLETADPERRAEVWAEIPESGIINLKTSNVRRLLLERESLPFVSRGSIAVRVDGQGIEWQRKYESLELLQLPNGSWEIVRPPAKP
ncbi:MAG: hypothetical protein AMXMBFR47_26900 [Planctomycetota bacterium]